MSPTEENIVGPSRLAQPGKRSKSGCLTCRKRKKKCDETLCPETGGCWRCRNAGYQCEEFRRPPVIYERGTSSANAGVSRQNKRAKQSPEAALGETHRSEFASDNGTNQSTPSLEIAQRHSVSNSLSQFAGLVTSGETWPLLEAMPSAVSPDLSVPTPILGQSIHEEGHNLHRPCEIVGDCLFSGRHMCAACSTVAARLVDPKTSELSALSPMFASIPSFSTPAISRHPSPGPDGLRLSTPLPTQLSSRKSQTILESLIGYYSTLITCWAQGCDAEGLEGSTLFPTLVPYLLDRIKSDPPLRLSIAAVTAGYIGGSRLTWPPDVVAIHQWASTLRADRSSIAECVRANATFPVPATPDTLWSVSPGEGRTPDTSSMLSVNRRRRSTLATLDDLLVGQAQTLKQLAVCSLDEAINEHRARSMRVPGLGLTEKGFHVEVSKINSLLLTSVNLAIYTFAEETVESYYDEVQRMRKLVESTLGTFPPVNLSKLSSLDHLGFRTYVWCDVGTAIARGSLPHVQLLPLSSQPADIAKSSSTSVLDSLFSLPDSLAIALSETARLRMDFDGGDYSTTARRAAGVAVPAWVHTRAKEIVDQVKSTVIPDTLSNGSATCARMIKEACFILVYTLIYRVGSLHPVIRQSLTQILTLWTDFGERYCRSVGCSNYNIPMFIAASVAIDPKDRVMCAKAMQIVGHEEAAPSSSRALIHQLWTTTDTTGLPCFWNDLVASGEHTVAFF